MILTHRRNDKHYAVMASIDASSLEDIVWDHFPDNENYGDDFDRFLDVVEKRLMRICNKIGGKFIDLDEDSNGLFAHIAVDSNTYDIYLGWVDMGDGIEIVEGEVTEA